jgi:hypothetical protein
MRIVGDPAWLQQGECGIGISASAFNFSPFNPDGGINFDAQAIMFDVSFNQPVDYDFNTGIMNTSAMNRQGLPQEHYTFTAIECKSIFSKGKFEQELKGKLVTDEIKAATKTSQGRSTTGTTGTTGAATTSATNVRSSPVTAEQIVAEQNASFEYGTTEGSEQTRMLAEQDAGLFDEPPPATQPAPPPESPTSSGDIDYNTGLASSGEEVATAPQQIARDDS